MYTEIKEVVNFIAAPLFGRIPRRKVLTFSEQLANFLLIRYRDIWNDSPADEKRRLVLIKVGVTTPSGHIKMTTDLDVVNAAKTIAVETEELLTFLPDGVVLHVNPGGVFISHNIENSQVDKIWAGPPDEDKSYRPLPEFIVQYQTTMENELGCEVHIDTEKCVMLKVERVVSECPAGAQMESVFELLTGESVPYTVEQFAVTRFGSHRPRPDHEVMKRIQKQAALQAAIAREEDVEESDSISVTATPSLLSLSSPADILRSLSPAQKHLMLTAIQAASAGSPSITPIINALTNGLASISNPHFPPNLPVTYALSSFEYPSFKM